MKNREKIQKKKFYIVMAFVFFLLVGGFSLVNIVGKDREFSDSENRMLALKPDFTREKLVSGRYTTDYETYVNDQFPLRTAWISIKAGFDVLLGKEEANGVYKGKDGYLLEQFEEPDFENLTETANAIVSFADRHPEKRKFFLLAPNAVNVLSDKLPAFAPESSQNRYMDALFQAVSTADIQTIDLRGTFAENKDSLKLYYKTDHHWTTDGAFLAFRYAGPVLGIDPAKVSYEILPVTDKFNGTLSSKSGLHMMQTEEIKVYYPIANYLPSVITYVNDQVKTTTFYNEEKLEEKDAYAMFLNGNHGLVTIETPVADRSKRLLILKDSYANCMIPFLSQYYREIVVVDSRYYYDELETLLAAEEISDILFLYNANTFFQDTTLKTILE